MKIHFSTDFRSIANCGETTDVESTVTNFINGVRSMIEQKYPDADIEVIHNYQMRASCTVLVDGVSDDVIAEEILLGYYENEFSECWV